MVVLLERLLYPNTYSETLEGCQVGREGGRGLEVGKDPPHAARTLHSYPLPQVEMGALGILVRAKLPLLGRHLRDLGAETQLFSTDW